MKEVKHTHGPERCYNCNEVLNPKKIKWLELSQTDGQFYDKLPAMHVSQGAFAFGTACATNRLKQTTAFLQEKREQQLSKFTHIMINIKGRSAERVIDRDVEYYTAQMKKLDLDGRVMPFEVAFNAPETASKLEAANAELELAKKTIIHCNQEIESLKKSLELERTHVDGVAAERDRLKEENIKLRTGNADLLMDTEIISQLQDLNRELVEGLQWFCDRVDKGEVRSKNTYERFKSLLKKASEIK